MERTKGTNGQPRSRAQGLRTPTAVLLGLAIAVALALPETRTSAAGEEPPAAEDLPALAVSLHDRLAGPRVRLPDGTEGWVVAPVSPEPPADERSTDALLDRESLEVCLATVSEAGVWPAAWLVVQRAELPFDLVMRVALDADGQVAAPDVLFTVPRRDWQPGDMKRVARDALGRKPPKQGLGNLVIQGFSRRIRTIYVYEPHATGEGAKGLAALLPQGSLIREAQTADLRDGRRYTLAIVLRDARFVPSDCRSCGAEVFGHADSGTVELVLAGEHEIVARVDLTAELRGVDGSPLVPRYRCEEGDDAVQGASDGFWDRVRSRPLIRLLELGDLDGDGLASELTLLAEQPDCRRLLELDIHVSPDTLSVSGRRERALAVPSEQP